MEAIFWPALLLALGLGLMVAELFLPTGGALGILATISLLTSYYLAQSISSSFGPRWAAGEVALVGLAWAGAIYGMPRTRLGRKVYLRPPSDEELADHPDPGRANVHLGRSGRALTPLRPSGMIELDGRRVEAMAETGLIGAGAAVTVVAVRSGRAVVREA